MFNNHLFQFFLILFFSFNYVSASEYSVFTQEVRDSISCRTKNDKIMYSKYRDIVQCQNDQLCIINNHSKKICFKDKGEGDAVLNHYFRGLLTDDIAIIEVKGYEEAYDYYISIKTGNIVLVLPSTSLAKTQFGLSPNKADVIFVTTNNGYDGYADITDIIFYKMREGENIVDCGDKYETLVGYNIACKEWPEELHVSFKEKIEGYKNYKISWPDDLTVKVQSLKSIDDYILFYKENNTWKIKEKHYKTWKDYNLSENE